MKKRFLAFAAACMMTFSLFIGCSGEKTEEVSVASEKSASEVSKTSSSEEKAENTDSNEGKKITALFFSLEGEYFTLLDDLLKEGLTELGYTYESQSSNFDPVKQIEQIENATASGTTCIWLWAADGKTVADACKKAREQGVLIYSFVQDPQGNADVVRGTDEIICGTAIGEMACEWADKTYGTDAAPKSIRTFILGNEDSENQKVRTETMLSILEEDGRFDIIDETIVKESLVEAQSATENAYAKYGDTFDCIMTVGGDMALGIMAYITSETSVVEDPTRIGIFGAEMSAETAEYMKNGIYKGSVLNGGNIIQNIAVQIEEMNDLIHGRLESGTFSAVDVGKVTVDNLADYGY